MLNHQTYIKDILPNMEGWCSPEKAAALVECVRESNPGVAVEIGVFAGRSLITIALAMDGVGGVIGIDPWASEASVKGFHDANREWWQRLDHEVIFRECLTALKLVGVKNVQIIRATSAAAIGCVPATIDFLHIDGNHSEDSACFDVANYVPRVRSGGYVWFDDTDWGTTKRAQEMLSRFCALQRMVGTCGVYRKA